MTLWLLPDLTFYQTLCFSLLKGVRQGTVTELTAVPTQTHIVTPLTRAFKGPG